MTDTLYGYDDDERLAVDALRRFLDERLEPQIRAHGQAHFSKAQLAGWMGELAEFGLINAPLPEEAGGLGQNWRLHLRLFEEVAYSSIDLAIPLLMNTVCASIIHQLAPRHLRDRYLPALLRGETIAAMGISEPNVGSDVSGVRTRAVRDGDHWIISGEKTWISNGAHSDFLICTCSTGEGELTHILLERDKHPYEVRGIEKIALNGQSTAQIFLDDVRVPVTNMIGQVGDGLRNTLSVFERARVHVAALGYGLARRAKDEAIRYARDRVQHGKPIAAHQLIADKIATMATRIDAARLLALRAASMIDEGKRCDAECAMAKWYGTEIAVEATRQAVQIHGGNGVTSEFIVERLAREAIILPIPDGTTEIQKLIIARTLTGISAFS
ncbi:MULTISPECIES: acyl-CoA dehydrogenase family protein [Sphingobium]|uniref:acyl-CoA dehydrogenase family protein n=1 Tax=Sphingobium TaxID=165695 RepID=UPI00159C11F0|nr:acyl-CoA dehydrogenase family protein [Sphingobium sp. 15-1]